MKQEYLIMQPTNRKNQNKDSYVQARQALLTGLKTELAGPEEDPGILLIENPVTRYAAGVIFPYNYEKKESAQESQGSEKVLTVEGNIDADSPADDVTAALANSFFPSAMGMSFYCSGRDPELKVTVEYATYEKAGLTEAWVKYEGFPEEALHLPEFIGNFIYENGLLRLKKKTEKPRELEEVFKGKIPEKARHALHRLVRSQSEGAWLRTQSKTEVTVSALTEKNLVREGLEFVVVRKHVPDKDLTLFTVALKNCNERGGGLGEESAFFQTSIKVEAADGSSIFREYGTGGLRSGDEEDANLAMLYRRKKTYAVGHGCAANWTVKDEGVQAVFTDVIPTYELPQANFEVEGLEQSRVLEMQFLANAKDGGKEIFKSLESFCILYKKWIENLRQKKAAVPAEFSSHAEQNIKLCGETYSRMMEGILTLKNNPEAFTAFQFANKAMLMQSVHSDLQKKRRITDGNTINWPDISDPRVFKDRKWRPFQLAFLLLSVKGIVDPASEDRNIVDLIWFPTGGGKTEAYLGLSAFTIFYSRIKQQGLPSGTIVIMRYTLRLLTAQQFQRACTLICAMELVRRENAKLLGDEEISIGLWVGSAATPNTVADAERQFEEFRFNHMPCPSPVLSCPWCGTRMLVEEGGHREYSMRKKSRPLRIELFCKEPSCKFNGRDGRLPIKFVDEDIYNNPSTLLFGTVDKFAQMPRKKGVSKIFGLENSRGPELIIQDELHLISGALGTMVALYEMAVDFLCYKNGRKPKIIASTATVRRAGDQCKNLFGRSSRQFPPPGLDIEDSFFSKEDTARPGRLYVGVMPSGKTQTTASIRLTARLMQGVYELPFPDEIKDKYATLVCYFNSIRELGGFISLVNDDIKQYANDLRLRYGGYMRPIYRFEEMTSRRMAEEIPLILEQLSIEYSSEEGGKKQRKNRPIDILVATNMISVGVDIDRFGLMLVRGQPKMTSEYIQVTSRIGRKYPGLVVTLYNPARTRDRAHYERFITYHRSFYRNVEPSSITPFSLPARIRGLNAVLVSMARHTLGVDGINEEQGVAGFKTDLPGVGEIKDFILQRSRLVDPAETGEVGRDIERAWQEWEAFAAGYAGTETRPVYSNQRMGKGRALLATSAKDKRPVGWVAPTSMRNVDVECNINIKDE